jgi:hypothetical protein
LNVEASRALRPFRTRRSSSADAAADPHDFQAAAAGTHRRSREDDDKREEIENRLPEHLDIESEAAIPG